jgi:hypothetical protein
MIKHKTFVSTAALVLGASLFTGGKAIADQVIPDDLIVQGSTCVGLDCVNNESFSFDTIRMKENNTRIKFDDTSTQPGFPATDWQITANDSPSGGDSYLAFDDVTNVKQPFRVTANAPTASMFVSSTGRIGFRTSTPVLDLHINTSNTPAHRFEQNASGGFTAQTWDIGANEANFFVRDATGGSLLPLRIRPGAPTSSLDIAASGNVGLGTASPDARLEVTGGGVFIGGSTAGYTGGELTLNGAAGSDNSVNTLATGAPRMFFDHRGSANTGSWFWRNGTVAGSQRMSLDSTGNLTVAGCTGCASDRNLKANIQPLTPASGLEAISRLRPVTFNWREEWRGTALQYGFIAQEAQSAFPDLIGRADPTPLTPDGTMTFGYQNLIAPMVLATQELNAKVTDLSEAAARSAERHAAKEVVASERLCIGKTCITEDELKAFLAARAGADGTKRAALTTEK